MRPRGEPGLQLKRTIGPRRISAVVVSGGRYASKKCCPLPRWIPKISQGRPPDGNVIRSTVVRSDSVNCSAMSPPRRVADASDCQITAASAQSQTPKRTIEGVYKRSRSFKRKTEGLAESD